MSASPWSDERRFFLTGRLHPSDEVAIREARQLLNELPTEFRAAWRDTLTEFVDATPGAERDRARANIAALHSFVTELSFSK